MTSLLKLTLCCASAASAERAGPACASASWALLGSDQYTVDQFSTAILNRRPESCAPTAFPSEHAVACVGALLRLNAAVSVWFAASPTCPNVQVMACVCVRLCSGDG